jgi:hypothetical protein
MSLRKRPLKVWKETSELRYEESLEKDGDD